MGSGVFTYLAEAPFLVHQQFIVIIRDDSRAECPRPFEPTSIGVASTHGMGAAEGDNLTVVETHAAEDGTQMRLFFGAVGQTSVWGAHGYISVGSAGAPGYHGSLHLLDRTDACKCP